MYTTPSFFDDTGDLVISAGLDTGHLAHVLRLIGRELRRLRDDAPSTAELRRARDYVMGQIDLGQESTDNQMNWIGEQMLGYGRILPPPKPNDACSKSLPPRSAASRASSCGRIASTWLW